MSNGNTIQIVHSLLWGSNIQDTIDQLMSDDPPRNRSEYVLARNYVFDLILECQPRYQDQAIRREEAVKIRSGCQTPNKGLIENWFVCGVLSYAMADYPMVFESTLAAQETANQLQDDPLLITTAWFCLGLSLFCFHQGRWFMVGNVTPEVIAGTAASLLQDGNPYAHLHSREARELVAHGVHRFVYLLWHTMYGPDGRKKRIVTDEEAELILQLAKALDQSTHQALRLEQWVKTKAFNR